MRMNSPQQARGKPNSQSKPASSRTGQVARRRQQEQPQQRQQHQSTANALAAAQLLQYERKGYLVTPQLLDTGLVKQLNADIQQHTQQHMFTALQQRIRVLCPSIDPSQAKTPAQARRLLAQHAMQPLGFLQFFHLHRTRALVQQLVHSGQLAGTAAQLMGVQRVRLYQDCVFLKEPGHSDTNWHSDLRMAPFDTNAFITAWIPMRDIRGSEVDSGLQFAAGSHRDFALPFWHNLEGLDLGARGYTVEDTGCMRVGDVSWHHGWALHCAGPQPPNTPQRLALAVSFFADGAKLLAVKSDASVHGYMQHGEDAESYSDWLADLPDGAVAAHPKLPIVYGK